MQDTQIHFAFERETDAETIGKGVAAELQSGDQEWASRRCFKMDSATSKTICDALDAI